jgi:DNA-binding MarR family transcriptional regulator
VAPIYDTKTYEPRNGVGHLLGKLRGEMLAALDKELAADERLSGLGVSGAQLVIIAALASSSERKSASDLCKGISYDGGAMTRMLDRLEAKGLLRRERCPKDRRLVYLELTTEGKAAYPRMKEISRTVGNRFLQGFSPTEARQLEQFLRRMLENV